jgi:hypothetical protein
MWDIKGDVGGGTSALMELSFEARTVPDVVAIFPDVVRSPLIVTSIVVAFNMSAPVSSVSPLGLL